MACTICDGAARNRGLATSRRLTSSQNRRPPATDNTPPMLPWRRRSSMSVADLRNAGQGQPVDREIARQVTQLFERVDQPRQLRPGHLPGRLEIIALDEKIVGQLDLRLLDLADLHQDLHRL